MFVYYSVISKPMSRNVSWCILCFDSFDAQNFLYKTALLCAGLRWVDLVWFMAFVAAEKSTFFFHIPYKINVTQDDIFNQRGKRKYDDVLSKEEEKECL